MSNESPWSVTNVTPRGARRSRSRVSMAGSVGKRSGTPAAEYLRWLDGPGSPGSVSVHGFELSQGTELDDAELDFEINDSMASDRDGYDGLENVRACCDGCVFLFYDTLHYQLNTCHTQSAYRWQRIRFA